MPILDHMQNITENYPDDKQYQSRSSTDLNRFDKINALFIVIGFFN